MIVIGVATVMVRSVHGLSRDVNFIFSQILFSHQFFFVTSSTFEKKTPKFEGALKVNSMLTKTERLFEGKVFGPESMAFDSKGKYNVLVD